MSQQELDFSRLGSSPLHIMAIPQRRLEELLGERLRELGGTVRRGHELAGLVQDEDAVALDVRGPDGDYRLRAGYVVGCDGAHSQVRKRAGIGFPGVTSTEASRIGRVILPTAKIARGGREVKVPGIGRLKLMTQVRTPGGELMEGSDVRYPMPSGSAQPHPLLGRLAPDLPLETAGGGTRVAELMRAAQGVLLDLSPGLSPGLARDCAVAAAEAASGRASLMRVVAARTLAQPAPAAALLIRPDGYVAWAAGPGASDHGAPNPGAPNPGAPDPIAGLNEALSTWFSPAE